MSSARRLPPMRSVAVMCALGSSVLLMAACTNADTTRSSVAEAAQTGSPTGTASPTDTTSSPTASPTASEDQDKAERKALVPMAKVTWDKAADTAVKEVSGSKLVDLELKKTSAEATASPTGSPMPSTPNPAPSTGAPTWEAKVAASDGTVHRIDIDAVSGKVFRTQVETDQSADDKKEIADRLSKATQTPQQAVKVATGKAKGTVTGVELDENDNQQVMWAVDVVDTGNWNETTVDVDATNGKILSEHVDSD
ncbi:PepSY domain-containing protein [Streptomyces flaveolus]|uniref:PepSY domain-containing protein n=1 Tax=Streptomyces flaveolus TaxID=67297 RepID=UPI0036F77488